MVYGGRQCLCGAAAAHLISYLYRDAARTLLKSISRAAHLEWKLKGPPASPRRAFGFFGEPFGSPVPQRPQPLDFPLRVGRIVRGTKRGVKVSSNPSRIHLLTRHITYSRLSRSIAWRAPCELRSPADK